MTNNISAREFWIEEIWLERFTVLSVFDKYLKQVFGGARGEHSGWYEAKSIRCFKW